MKKLRIAQLAPPFISVPQSTHGGTEAVIHTLTEELVRRGHEVTLFASGDSKTSAKLVSAFPEALNYESLESMLSPLARNLKWMYSLPVMYHAMLPFEHASSFDIIHDHTHYLGLLYSRLTKTPMVSTYHGSFQQAEESPVEKLLLEKYRENNWVAISKNQMKHATIPLQFAGVVHHGIHVNQFDYQEYPEDYLVWLGRITPRKGVKEAISIAKKTRHKLVLAGVVKQRDEAYFEAEIKPLIDGKAIQYIGPVRHMEKMAVLKNARALIYPLQWEEPFGMVLIEAMACGTPVITFNRGAVPEIVVDGKTGFVTRSETDMIAAVGKLDQIKRKDCRDHVTKQFSVESMADNYEAIYRQVLTIQKNN